MTKKILTVVGARPQIIKSAAISRAIAGTFADRLDEVIVHTGQHYDHEMSEVFFEELQIPKPRHNLAIGSSSHAVQTAAMLMGLEEVIKVELPDAVLIYGDTNSTLAAALTASKLNLPIIHVESGLRSFNKGMPEEVNRIVADHLSSLLLAPTRQAVENLQKEGFQLEQFGPINADHPLVIHCGDIMLDNALHFEFHTKQKSDILKRSGIEGQPFFLATIHRDANTDDFKRLTQIFTALLNVAKHAGCKIVIPLHPRTLKMLERVENTELKGQLVLSNNIVLLDPVSYLDMIALESAAKIIFTDSGGVQKEAFFFKKPCVILRPQTEWTELVENGNAIIADAEEEKIMKAYLHFTGKEDFTWPAFYGDGKAAEFICNQILRLF